VLIKRTDTSEQWLVEQQGRRLVAVDQVRGGWAVRLAGGERFDGVQRRRRRHLGWHMELTAAGEPEPVLGYYPYTVFAGGSLVCAGGERFTLRRPLVGRSDWTLSATGRKKLAHLQEEARRREPKTDPARPGLTAAARGERNIGSLLAASALAMALHLQTPTAPQSF
jgi:hypothetical protein